MSPTLRSSGHQIINFFSSSVVFYYKVGLLLNLLKQDSDRHKIFGYFGHCAPFTKLVHHIILLLPSCQFISSVIYNFLYQLGQCAINVTWLGVDFNDTAQIFWQTRKSFFQTHPLGRSWDLSLKCTEL